MDVQVEKKNGWIVFHLEGDLDAGSAVEMQARFLKSLDEGHAMFLLDLEKVDYLDSSGLAALVKFYKEVRARGGTMALCAVQKETMKIFQLTRLDKIFTIYPDADSAQAA